MEVSLTKIVRCIVTDQPCPVLNVTTFTVAVSAISKSVFISRTDQVINIGCASGIECAKIEEVTRLSNVSCDYVYKNEKLNPNDTQPNKYSTDVH